MNISADKIKTPLGKKLFFEIPDWQRTKIRLKLIGLGLTEGQWRGIYQRKPAHLLPTYIRDVIIEELPETEELFCHPDLVAEPSK